MNKFPFMGKKTIELMSESEGADQKPSVVKIPRKYPIKRFMIAGAIVLLAALAWKPRNRVISYDKPVPYIYNRQFLTELTAFAGQKYHKEVLVIHGAGGVGKTRGLLQFIQKLNGDDRLVFNFDMKLLGRTSNLRDWMDYFELVIVRALQKFEGKQVRISELKNSLVLVEAMATVDGMMTKDVRIPLKDVSCQRVARALVSVVERMPDSAEVAVRSLMEGIDALAPLRPVIVWNDNDDLPIESSEELANVMRAFWKVCENFANDFRTLGVIVEVSDEAMSRMNNESISWMRLRKVSEFSPEDAKLVLVKQSFFASASFQFLKEKFGGHGQSYAAMHDLLREGMTANGAYLQLERQTQDRLIRAIELDGTSDRRLKLLRELKARKIVPLSFDPETTQHMLHWKVVSLYNLTHCTFANKIVDNSVEAVIKQLRK